jgi:putative alpha-1,2-mannosidase
LGKGTESLFCCYIFSKIKQQIFIDDSIKTNTQAYGNNVKIALQFNTENPLLVRVGISSVGTDQAFNSLQESEHQTFNEITIHAENLWEKELQKIKINTNNQQQAQQFYTALYRTCLAPVVHSDKDGSYQTHDNKQLKFTKGKEKYTVFSQWDVFRALNPLFTLTQTKRLPDMINSMLQLYEDNGLLPVWDLSTWEANTMTGYHSIPIIADAI